MPATVIPRDVRHSGDCPSWPFHCNAFKFLSLYGHSYESKSASLRHITNCSTYNAAGASVTQARLRLQARAALWRAASEGAGCQCRRVQVSSCPGPGPAVQPGRRQISVVTGFTAAAATVKPRWRVLRDSKPDPACGSAARPRVGWAPRPARGYSQAAPAWASESEVPSNRGGRGSGNQPETAASFTVTGRSA